MGNYREKAATISVKTSTILQQRLVAQSKTEFRDVEVALKHRVTHAYADIYAVWDCSTPWLESRVKGERQVSVRHVWESKHTRIIYNIAKSKNMCLPTKKPANLEEHWSQVARHLSQINVAQNP